MGLYWSNVSKQNKRLTFFFETQILKGNNVIKNLKYTPFRNERDNLFHYFSVMKSSKNKFHFFTCILPDYVAHESPKEF